MGGRNAKQNNEENLLSFNKYLKEKKKEGILILENQ